MSASWIWGYPALPASGPPRGSIDGLIRPSSNTNTARPSQGDKPREAGNAKTPEGIGLLRLAPKGRRVLCNVASRGSANVSHDDQAQGAPGGRRAQVSSSVQGRQGAGAESRGISQRFPFWCNETKTARTAGRRSSTNPPQHHDQRLFAGEDYFCQDRLYYLSPFKSGHCGIPSRSYLGRGWRPL